jgi:hypothetical protein
MWLPINSLYSLSLFKKNKNWQVHTGLMQISSKYLRQVLFWMLFILLWQKFNINGHNFLNRICHTLAIFYHYWILSCIVPLFSTIMLLHCRRFVTYHYLLYIMSFIINVNLKFCLAWFNCHEGTPCHAWQWHSI